MKDKIVISGGSGLVGMHLTELLLNKGYEVVHLSRVKNSRANVKVFLWDYKKGILEKGALDNCSYIIHLAGAPIMDERWKFKRKLEIIASRVDTAKFLIDQVKQDNIPLKSFISSSGINLYEWNTKESHDENAAPADNFLAKVVQHWEAAAKELNGYCNVAFVRTSMVLDKDAGALKKIADVVKLNLGSPLGYGDQYMPWIHYKDLCNMYLYILENNLSGPFNALADEQITNADFTKTLARVLGKKYFMPHVPESFLKSRFGKSSELLLNGIKASNAKIKNTGFEFKFSKIEDAFKDIYRK